MLYKKELNAVPPMVLDKISMKKADWLGVSQIVQAKRSGEVLIVDVYQRARPRNLVLRFFSNKNTFQIYDARNDVWIQKKIQPILSGKSGHSFYYGFIEKHNRIAATENSLQMIKKFLGSSRSRHEGITGIIDDYIGSVEREKRIKVRDNKELRIEEKMNMYPELPKGLKDYLREDVFKKYVFMSKAEKGKKPGVCTACGRKLKLNKGIKHKTTMICPKCGQEVIAVESRYITSIKERAKVCIADKVNNQLILRWIDVQGYWYGLDKNGKYEFGFSENEYFRMMYLYENGKEKIRNYDFKYVWPYGAYWREKNYRCIDHAYVYNRNLESVFGKKYYNVDLQKELSENTQPIDFVKLLDNLKTLPPTEYLVKMGMCRLASQIHPEKLNEGREFGKILGINPQYKKLYSDWNISLEEHELIQASKAWVNEDEFLKMRRLNLNSYQATRVCNILSKMSYKRFVNYFTKQRKIYPRHNFDQILTWYNDYIKMSEQMEIDLSHKSVRFPRDIKEAHDRLLKEYEVVENEILDAQLKAATERLYNGLTNYKSDGYAIVFPQTRTEFIVEGQSLNHCVGTQETYFNNHLEGTKMIFFIRREDEITKPFVTMQIDMRNLRILQIYGYSDKRPAADVIRFANKFLSQLKKDVVRRAS